VIAQRTQGQPWKPQTFDDQVWLAYTSCVTAGRIMESESKGAEGLQHFESRPSEDAFELAVSILQAMLEGANWLDDDCKKVLQPTPIIGDVNVRDHPYDRGRDRVEKQKVGEKEQSPFERFSALTGLLHRKGFFREKRIQWTPM